MASCKKPIPFQILKFCALPNLAKKREAMRFIYAGSTLCSVEVSVQPNRTNKKVRVKRNVHFKTALTKAWPAEVIV